MTRSKNKRCPSRAWAKIGVPKQELGNEKRLPAGGAALSRPTVLGTREFPLTLTLSPIGGEGIKKELS
jgi:hypothetical protein